MNPEQLKEYIGVLKEALEPLAQKIGQTSEAVFAMAMRRNYAIAVFDTAVVIAWIVAFAVVVRTFRRWADSEWAEGIFIIGLFGGLLFTVFAGISFYDAVMRFVSPEFSTMEDLVKLVRQ